MREILFRGKRIDNGEWVYGSLILWNDGDTEICITSSEEYGEQEKATVCPETVGQFTGLNDKNGKKIFEGDIVESVFTSRPYLVCFGKHTYIDEYGEEECASGWYNEEEGGYKTALACTDVWATVIGNIHDNPELMEGKA